MRVTKTEISAAQWATKWGKIFTCKRKYQTPNNVERNSATHNLKQCQIRGKDMIEVNFWSFPGVVKVGVGQAVVSVVDQSYADKFTRSVDTRLKSTAKQIDSHDAED